MVIILSKVFLCKVIENRRLVVGSFSDFIILIDRSFSVKARWFHPFEYGLSLSFA